MLELDNIDEHFFAATERRATDLLFIVHKQTAITIGSGAHQVAKLKGFLTNYYRGEQEINKP